MLTRIKQKLGQRQPDPLLTELTEAWVTKTNGEENARVILQVEQCFVTLKTELKELADGYPAINQHFSKLCERIDSLENLAMQILRYPRGKTTELVKALHEIMRLIIGPYVAFELRQEEVKLPILSATSKLAQICESNYDETVLDTLEYVLRLARQGIQREKQRYEMTLEELNPDQGWDEEEVEEEG